MHQNRHCHGSALPRCAAWSAQTDGWLSEQSAKVYEVSTETLFLGRQDAMQRQTLVPLHKFMAGRPAHGTGVRALEVAAGTGRFATFTKVRHRPARNESPFAEA